MAKKIQKSFSKIHYSFLLILGGLLLLLAVSCQAAATQPAVTQTLEPESIEDPVSDIAEEETTDVSGEGQAQGVADEDLNQCLVCHTDQQTLEDTADLVVVVESESSGEG